MAPAVPVGSDRADAVAVGDESLRVHAFAPHAIVVNGHTVDPTEWRYSKPRELLFFLLDFPGATKDQIGSALWPDATASQIRGSFHVALHHLRRVLGDASLVTHNRGRYSLRHGLTVWYDVSVFEAQLDSAAALLPSQHEQAIDHLGAAIDLAAGQFLPDIDGDWASARRNELQWRLDDALQSLADLLLAAGREQEAAEIRAQGKARIAARGTESGPTTRPAHTIRVPNSHTRTDPDRIARLMSSPAPTDPSPRLDAWRQRGSA
jgi:two-component SAPR family response regulator